MQEGWYFESWRAEELMLTGAGCCSIDIGRLETLAYGVHHQFRVCPRGETDHRWKYCGPILEYIPQHPRSLILGRQLTIAHLRIHRIKS